MSVNSEQNKSLLNELLKSLINENKFDYNEKEFNNYFNQSCDYYNTQRHESSFQLFSSDAQQNTSLYSPSSS